MNVIVNIPESKDDMEELENRIAYFRATLLIKKIESLNYSNKSKKKLLNRVLEYLESKCIIKN